MADGVYSRVANVNLRDQLEGFFHGIYEFSKNAFIFGFLPERKHVRQVMQGDKAFTFCEGACPRSPELPHVGTASQSLPQVVTEFANIGSSLAANSEKYVFAIDLKEVQVVYF